MKRINYNKLIVTSIIILSIVFILFFNYYYFFKSPQMIEVNKVNEIVELFEVNNDKTVEFEARYFSDIAYYSATDANNLYVFDDSGKLLTEIALKEINVVNLFTDYKFEPNAKIAYAIYEEELVYTVTEQFYDYFVSQNNNEVVLKIRKGIANDRFSK